MKPPVNAKIYEDELGTFWLDELGILCTIAKNPIRTTEKIKNTYALIKQITGNKKVCLLSETSHMGDNDKATRDYIAKELPNMFNAMALVSNTVFGNTMPKIFIALKNQPIPIQMFATEEEAKEWLKQYL